jgi:putative flippase GtrA
MHRLLDKAIRIFSDRKGRYLVVGAFNTVVNYVISAEIYQTLLPILNFFLVASIVTVIGISISFTTQKTFVFKTKGVWWVEYLRSYVVYGSSSVLNVGLMWLLLNRAHLNIWLAQALVTSVAVVISYIGHTAFTFRERKGPGQPLAASDSPE